MRRSPAAAAWVLLYAVVFVGGTLGSNHRAIGAPLVLMVLGVVLTLAVMVAVPLHAPLGLFAMGLLTSSYFGKGYADGPIFLAVPAAALLLGAMGRESGRRLAGWSTLAVVLVVPGLVEGRDLAGPGGDRAGWPASTLIVVALTAAGAAIGHTLAARRRERTAQATRAVSEEQLRMARDLHDGVGHGLAVIAMQAGAALHVLERDPIAARGNLEAIRDQSRESLETLRAELAQLGGEQAPRRPAPGLADLGTLVDRVRGGGLEVVVTGAAGTSLPGRVDQAAYAVVQESLTNVLRHAEASRASVDVLPLERSLVVVVADDGGGAAGTEPPGSGLAGMRARVEALGGRLEAGPAERGFRVRAELPLGDPL